MRRTASAFLSFVAALALTACEVGDPLDVADEDTTSLGAASTAANVQRAVDFGRALIGTDYGWWFSGPLPKGEPMWTAGGTPPSVGYVRARSANCTGLTNLMLRAVGKPLPHAPGAGTGGTYAYQKYYASVAEPFNPNRSYPAGTLLGRRYRDTYDQGHVAVVLGNGRVLQSFAWTRGGSRPGVNATYTVAQSHDGGYYHYAVLPQHWLGGTGDCGLGDGLYCGGNGVEGAADTLYRCTGGTPKVEETCDAGCQWMPAGTSDRCAPASAATTALVIDGDNAANDESIGYAAISDDWQVSDATAGAYGDDYAFASVEAVSDPAVFWFYLPEAATRTVDAWWTAGSNRSSSAPFLVLDAEGKELAVVEMDQRSGGGTWNTLGSFRFTKGWNRVMLSRWTSDGDVVIADAVRVR